MFQRNYLPVADAPTELPTSTTKPASLCLKVDKLTPRGVGVFARHRL